MGEETEGGGERGFGTARLKLAGLVRSVAATSGIDGCWAERLLNSARETVSQGAAHAGLTPDRSGGWWCLKKGLVNCVGEELSCIIKLFPAERPFRVSAGGEFCR